MSSMPGPCCVLCKAFYTHVVLEASQPTIIGGYDNQQRNPIIIYNIERRDGLHGVEALA